MKMTAFENNKYRFVKTKMGYHVQEKLTKKWLSVIISRKECEKYQ